MVQRIKPFLLRYGPLLITFAIFLVAYFIGGQMYPTMRKPQVFFNLFIASMLLAVSANNVGLMWVAIEATTLASAFGVMPPMKIGRVGYGEGEFKIE